MAVKRTTKMNNTDIALIILVVILLYFVISKGLKVIKQNKENKKVEPNGGASNPTTPTTPTSTPDLNLVLAFGSKGLEVGLLQKKLSYDITKINNSRPFGSNSVNSVGSIDGVFGQKTKDALYNVKGVVQTSLSQYDKIPNKK